MNATNLIAGSAAVVTPSVFPVELVGAMIPVLVPMLIALYKVVLPKIPTWSLPLMAPVIGLLLNAVLTYANGAGVNPWVALALGASGTGLREIQNQLAKVVKQPPDDKITLPP